MCQKTMWHYALYDRVNNSGAATVFSQLILFLSVRWVIQYYKSLFFARRCFDIRLKRELFVFEIHKGSNVRAQ